MLPEKRVNPARKTLPQKANGPRGNQYIIGRKSKRAHANFLSCNARARLHFACLHSIAKTLTPKKHRP